MAEHRADVSWSRGDQVFTDNKYSRRHLLSFDGGQKVMASSSPHVVPVPYSDPAGVDPEEGLVASIASCHMLWFLGIAAGRGFRVDSYDDSAVGVMRKNDKGKYFVAQVTLQPRVRFSGPKLPNPADFADMHHEAHEECYIANSVKSEVRCEPLIVSA
jgi:organic hydroperoxide reductase OsmC/OhrA